MTEADDFFKEARRQLLATKLWGRTCEEPIQTGQWDGGRLILDRVDALLKARPEVIDE